MIFVTVGSQMPFDRLILAVDAWAAERNRTDVVAQIGDTDLVPTAIEFHTRLPPAEFERYVADADVVVAHAGMGSILTALRVGTPILVMPRHGALRETRNDHQIATAERLLAQGKVAVAVDEHDLADRLDELDQLDTAPVISPFASAELLAAVEGFVGGK